MALSNWAVSALNNNGRTDGVFNDEELGYSLKIYKAKIYIYDESASREETGLKNDLILTIEGDSSLTYQNIRIDTYKPVTNEIYVTASIGYRHNDESNFRAFAGCGVYGYHGDEWVGVTDEQWERLMSHIESSRLVTKDNFDYSKDKMQYNLGDRTINQRMNEDEEIENLYEDKSDPLLEQVLDDREEDSS